MCGSKYDWGVFDEKAGEWKFPRYLIGGKPIDIRCLNERESLWYKRTHALLSVIMRSSRTWQRSLRIEAMMPEINAAFRGALAANLDDSFVEVACFEPERN